MSVHSPRRKFKPQDNLTTRGQPLETETSYSGNFRGTAVGRVEPVKPLPPTLGTDKHPFEGTSQYRQNFVGTKAPPAQSARPPPSDVLMTGKFTATSSTRDNFHAFPGAKPAEPFKHNDNREPLSEDRSFHTENAGAFNNKGAHSVRAPAAPLPSQIMPSFKFEGQSTTADSFKPWKPAPVQSYRPAQVHEIVLEDRDFASETRSHFNSTITPTFVRAKAPVSTALSSASSAPFVADTTTQSSFPSYAHIQAKPSTPFKPEVAVYSKEKDDRSFKTETQGNFVSLGFHKRPSAAPQSDPPVLTGPFTGSSTTRSSYVSFDGAKPAALMKPTVAREEIKEDRDFQTSSAINYNDKGYQARNRALAPNLLWTSSALPSGPFQSETSTKADYKAWNGAKPATPVKPPVSVAVHEVESRDFMTETRLCYHSSSTASDAALSPRVQRAKAPAVTIPLANPSLQDPAAVPASSPLSPRERARLGSYPSSNAAAAALSPRGRVNQFASAGNAMMGSPSNRR